MPLILNLDTSTQVCSVAVARDGEILGKRESRDEKSHSSQLAIFIHELFREQGMDASGLGAIAVSAGPGSYTGLRIGVSTAKGLAYGRDIQLIAIGTLDALAAGAYIRREISMILEKHPTAILSPMIDARRMEVYTALYQADGSALSDMSARVVEGKSYRKELESGPVIFYGNGAMKCREIITHPNAIFVEGIDTSAEFMVSLSEKSWQQKRFENVAYFEPFYLKDFIATVPRNKAIPSRPSGSEESTNE